MGAFYFIVFFLFSVQSFAGVCKIKKDLSEEIAAIFDRHVPHGSNGREAAGIVLHYKKGKLDEVLFERNAERKQAVASTQKILTAYVASLDGIFSNTERFTKNDLYFDSQGNRAVFRNTNELVEVDDLPQLSDYFYSLLQRSSNGSANALGRSVDGSLFLFMQRVNATAQLILGTSLKSYFQNPSGLTDSSSKYRYTGTKIKQGSTARELAEIMGFIIQKDKFRDSLVRNGFPYAGQKYLRKGGYTRAAGKTIVFSIPLGSKCAQNNITFALFGSDSSDQFEKYNRFYTELTELLEKNTYSRWGMYLPIEILPIELLPIDEVPDIIKP